MKCPFLEEVLVQYCTACPVKKMIPKDRIGASSPCEADYSECLIYIEFLGSAIKKKEEEMKQEIKQDVKASEGEKPCIWMKAGVIAYRMCTTDYDCKNCEFDQAITDASGAYVESPLVVEAIKKLRQLPAAERKCRYMLTGDFSYKICPNNYECWHCPVDQYIQDAIEASPYLRKRRERVAAKEKKVKGFTYKEDYYYTPNHIWLKVEGETIKIGIDEFAARIIGKITDVELPRKEKISKESECWALGSGNRIVRMKLPVDGEVVEINEAVKSDTTLLYNDPYNRGWLLKIKTPKEIVENMMKGARTKDWLEKEFEKLHEEFEEKLGVTITDGGELVPNLFERLTDEEWNNLVKKFLI